MKTSREYSLAWKLLLVPVVATFSFAAYLIYSSLVMSAGNSILKELRDKDFPILDVVEKNFSSNERLIDALNTAASTGETEFLDVAKVKAAEILDHYETLGKLDAAHKEEIEKLKSEFGDFFSLAFYIAQRMAVRADSPSLQQIMKMRAARDAYLTDAMAFRDIAEKDFHGDVGNAIEKSERAQYLGAGIGTLMLFVIVALTWRITRGILALEKVVADRNRKLAEVNTELEQEILKLKAAEEAKSQAETASQIKDEFLANMSHELRTPMNAIIGLSHLCLQTDVSRKQQDYLQKIHGSAKSLLGILNDILDVSKIEAGKLEIDQTLFDLEEVMGNLVTIVGDKFQEKNIEFLLETAPDVPLLLIGDPLRLGQVLINLAGNAVKFTEKGEVVLRVDLEKDAEDQVALRFTVKDTGIGMSQKDIDKLFRPFTQADTSITRKFGGTGLGLTISKRLVEMMGGNICVESAPGVGTKFIFTALFRKAKGQANYRQSVLNDMRGLRVIAVDDNERSLQILTHYLESFTFDVTVASNGEDAMKAIVKANEEGRPFDLAILDWKMPQMDGMELARKLGEMADLRVKPKVLLISAHGQNEILPYLDDQVVNGILEKPFQPRKLFDAVAKVCSRNESMSGKFRIGAQFNPELIAKVRGARLLLVEDNEINQQVAQELLESFGIKVIVAENGEEAIALLRQEQFDGVLMDMQMPVMDGVSATREIRKNPQFSKLPIIALTANVMVSAQNEILDAGMDDHIGKPIDPDKLIATLAKWLHPIRTTDIPEIPKPGPSVAAESLPDLPGVNVAESVRRIGGKVAIYYSILDRFRIDNRNAATRIRDALASNDQKTAERLAHTLRGIAGTIGAEALQNQAGLLESSIKNGVSNEVESLLTQIDQELAILIARIDQALEARRMFV